MPLYDYWREADGAFLVMRYMRGGSLKNLLEEGPLDLHTALASVWDVSSGEKSFILDSSDPRDAHFSPDGDYLATGSWSGALRLALQPPAVARCAYFTPDDEHLITCGDDGIVRMFTTNLDELV